MRPEIYGIRQKTLTPSKYDRKRVIMGYAHVIILVFTFKLNVR